MPLPPLPPNYTDRLLIHYGFGVGQSRTFQVRFNGVPVAGAIAAVGNFLNALTPHRAADWAVTSVDHIPYGGIVALPVGLPTVLPGAGGPISPVHYPKYTTFIGRGPISGRKVRIAMYGLVYADPGDYRINDGESATFTAARLTLELAGLGYFITIGGDMPVWKHYQNVGFQSHWEKEQRG